MSKTGSLSIVLQAGGESRRMGRPKATVPFLGEPLIWRGIRRLLSLADEFIITTNEPEKLSFLDELVDAKAIRLVSDFEDERGALPGMLSAFAASRLDYVALVACDMLFPCTKLFAAEHEALISTGADLAVPKTRFGYEPFHGVYRRATCLPLITAAYKAARKTGVSARATQWFSSARVLEFSAAQVAEIAPQGRCFMNVNTPEELRSAEQLILDGRVKDDTPSPANYLI